MPISADYLAGLFPVFSNFLSSMGDRDILDKEGNVVGALPADLPPVRAYKDWLRAEDLSESTLTDIRKTLTGLYQKTLEEFMVQSGMVAPEDAKAAVSSLPPGLLKLIGDASGYGQALNNIEKFMVQNGYKSLDTLEDPRARRAQKQRNEKLSAIAQGVFDYIRPDNQEDLIAGTTPQSFTHLITARPGFLEDVLDDPAITDPSGNLSKQGRLKLADNLNQLSAATRSLANLTGSQNLPEQLQQGQQLFGTNPLDVVLDKKNRDKLEEFQATAQHMGYTSGDAIGFLRNMGQISKEGGYTPEHLLSTATGILPYLSPEILGKFDKQEDRNQAFKILMSRAADPKKNQASRLLASSYGALRNSHLSNNYSRKLINSAITISKTPVEAVKYLNQFIDKPYRVTKQNYRAYLRTPEAQEYLTSSDSARNAVRWTGKQISHYMGEALEKAVGKSEAQTVFDMTGGRLPTEKQIGYIADHASGGDPGKRVRIANRLREASKKIAQRMGTDSLEALRRVSRMDKPDRLKSMMKKHQEIREGIPQSRPKAFGPTFMHRVLNKSGPWPALKGSLLKKPKSARAPETKTYENKSTNWTDKLQKAVLPK